ncbi:MAG: hypothetical protein JST70_08650 [Bacteroidetes bacterium]|nr:hypothetical protein [Bacteroidota bacterium]
MKRILLLCLLMTPLFAIADIKISSFKKMGEGLYIMYYDTTATKHYITKSTVVEFKDFIVLMEMPISTDGAGATNLTDHSADGEVVFAALKKKFPNKPLKYVLSTHWHPHSISSVIPFISRGITVVTTEKNYKRISEYIDSATYAKYGKYIHFVGDEEFSIKDKSNSIIGYRIDRKDYPHIPTEDFVFYYLPKYNFLHTSCMFQRFKDYRVMGKEMISVRAEDVHQFIEEHKMSPACFITTDTWYDDGSGLSSGDTLTAMYQKGITMTALENVLMQMDGNFLVNNSDSVIRYITDNSIPISIVNSAVYTCLKKHDLDKALAIARIQALISPSNPNSWDTYGEVYWFMGDKKMAKRYEKQCKLINKEFTLGGEASWEKDLSEYRQMWAEK